MSTARDAFLAVRDEMRVVLIERETAIDLALLALVARENFLQLGPPGVAKSYLVDQLHERIIGAEIFKILMHAATTPDELLGPVDFLALTERSEYKRRRAGSLSEAHIAFADEIYKSNPPVLHSFMGIVNERTISEIGYPKIPVPLISLYTASNELPVDDSLLAFDDRFALRTIVGPIVEDDAFMRMLLAPKSEPEALLSLDDIMQAQQEALAIRGTTQALQKYMDLRTQVNRLGLRVSDRRWQAALRILRAWAWLEGVDQFDVEGMAILAHVLWSMPRDRKAMERLVYQIACPLTLRAVEIEDQALDLVAKVPEETAPDFNAIAENTLQQLLDMHKELKVAVSRSNARNTMRAEQVLQRIYDAHKDIAGKFQKNVNRFKIDDGN